MRHRSAASVSRPSGRTKDNKGIRITPRSPFWQAECRGCGGGKSKSKYSWREPDIQTLSVPGGLREREETGCAGLSESQLSWGGVLCASSGGEAMMQEKKRAAAALVNGIAGNGNGRAATSSAVEGQGLSNTKAAGPTFQVWSRDSHGFCTECEDTRATVLCHECDEAYCSLCWAALHRRGERARHETIPLGSEEELAPPPEALEESGWLAGVWPSQRPRASPHPAIPTSSSSSAGAGTEVGGVSSENV
ncbi:unnamed protein product, partial [Ectocarpus sp. 12 AP-2014]